MIKQLLSWPVLINAVIFQITWLACVIGSSKSLLWPALLSCSVLAIWQLAPSRRHHNDFMLVVVAIILGLIIDTLWIQLGFINFTDQRPFSALTPAWIIILWVAFALTINHSLAWLTAHPLLPAVLGFICAPSSYIAGLKLGAVEYTADTILISLCMGVAWAIAMVILVKLGQLEARGSAQLQTNTE